MKTTTRTDREILETVSRTLDACHPSTPWADELFHALTDLGVAVGEADDTEPDLIVRLADGREVWETDQSATGWERFTIR